MYSLGNRASFRATSKTFPAAKPRCFVLSAVKIPALSRIQSRRLVPSLRCQADFKRQSPTKDPALVEFQKLIDAATVQSTTPEWVQEVQRRGQLIAAHVEQLRTAVIQKADELDAVEDRLNEMTAFLNEAKELQSATEAQLKIRNKEVQRLKTELQQLQQHRDEDVTASMKRYRELEDALASVESELHSQSESLQSKESSNPVDTAKLNEIVQEQNAVFQNLTESLKTASEEKQHAENIAQEARLKAEETERAQIQLQQDQELLSKELGQLQILYAEKEMEWTNDTQNVREENNKLKEDCAGLEVSLATKERKVEKLEASFQTLKSDFEDTSSRLAEIRREVAELKSVNQSLEGQLKGSMQSPEQEDLTQLKSELAKLQVRAPVLESEIDEMAAERKEAERAYSALEKEARLKQRQCAQLEQRATILQLSMEEKSNRLMAAHKEKKSLKTEADRLRRESATLRQRLNQREKEFEKVKGQFQEGEEERRKLRSQFEQEIMAIAQKQQEAQSVIVYHQEHKNENRDLKAAIAELKSQLENRKNEIDQIKQANAEAVSNLKKTLAETEEAMKDKQVELTTAQEEQERLKVKLMDLKESSKEAEMKKAAELADLNRQLQDSKNAVKSADSDVQHVKNEMAKLQNELSQRQRIISVRDQEIVTLKDDARLANERVDALRGQITSMQTLNREMEVEMTETDGVVSQMNARLRELQEEVEEKQKTVTELTKTISDLELKGKHSMQQFSSQIESLEEYSKQQEGLVESFFAEKQELQKTVDALNEQLAAKTQELDESLKDCEASDAECDRLKALLERSQTDLRAVKASASAEIDEAADILAKAESMAHSVQGSLDETSGLNGAMIPQSELQERIRQLENELKTEREAAIESEEHAEDLEAELLSLKQEVADLKKAQTDMTGHTVSDANAQNELISMSKRLSKSLAAEEAALSEIQRLREQLKAVQTNHSVHPGNMHVMTGDERFNDLRRHASHLESENEKLRKAASKRNQILAQSRHFIEQYLNRSTNSLTDIQP